MNDLDSYLEWEKSRNSVISNLLKKATPIHFVAFFGLLVLGVYFVSSSSGNKTWIAVGAVAIIVILILRSDKIEKKPIPEHILERLGLIALRRKIGVDSALPWGSQVFPLLFGGLRWQGDFGTEYKPWKSEKGYLVIKPDGRRFVLIVTFEAYEGWISGIRKASTGYDGQKLNDLKIIIPKSFVVDTPSPTPPKV